ncbi:4-hydroxybenzoyl-CoA thioesterase [Methylophilaceae bacterium]|nr:4-hydroxybenzoyl-CoA thioesterase [Methylophilaceae bacterium]
MSSFHWPIRVYYEDTDGGGVVYHANYLKFMERARTEWLRSLGFEQTELKSGMGIIFVVRGIDIQYKRPASFNDALTVVTTISKTGRSLLVFEQIVQRNNQIMTQATVEVACVSAADFKPVSIPQPIRLAMQAIYANNGV